MTRDKIVAAVAAAALITVTLILIPWHTTHTTHTTAGPAGAGLPPLTTTPIPAPATDTSRDTYLTTTTKHLPHASRGQLLDYAAVACAGLAAYGDRELAAAELVRERDAVEDREAAIVVGSVLGSGYCEATR